MSNPFIFRFLILVKHKINGTIHNNIIIMITVTDLDKT